jgi:hypothetical protein
MPATAHLDSQASKQAASDIASHKKQPEKQRLRDVVVDFVHLLRQLADVEQLGRDALLRSQHDA